MIEIKINIVVMNLTYPDVAVVIGDSDLGIQELFKQVNRCNVMGNLILRY